MMLMVSPFEDELGGIEHFVQVDERGDGIAFRDIAEGAEGEIYGLRQEMVKVPDAESAERFPEHQERIPVFVLRKGTQHRRRHRCCRRMERPFLCFGLQAVAGADKGTERQVKVEDHGRVVFHQDFPVPGVRHHVIEPVFGGCRFMEPEKGVHQAEGGIFPAVCPASGFKISVFLFHSKMLSG